MNNKLKKGFSLIEVIVTIAIVFLLTSILVPSMVNYKKKMKEQEFYTYANVLNQKTIAMIGKISPIYINFSEGIFIDYPLVYILDSNEPGVDYFSISNFSHLLKYWYSICDIDQENVLSEEYIKAEYDGSAFNLSVLKIIISTNLEVNFHMSIYADKYNQFLYSEIDKLIVKNLELNIEKAFEM